MHALTQSAQTSRSNQLHQLIVTHISQQVLQASLSTECRQLVAAATAAARPSGDGRVVEVFVHLTAVFFILVGLWLLMEVGNMSVWKYLNPPTIDMIAHFSYLHPEEQSLGSSFELQHIDPSGGALVHPLELTVIWEYYQVLEQDRCKINK